MHIQYRYTHIHTHLYTRTCMYTCIHTHAHTHTHTTHKHSLHYCMVVVESPSSDDEQGNMFSTFRMRNGEEYTVYNKDGKRYYVDWETQVGIIHAFIIDNSY